MKYLYLSLLLSCFTMSFSQESETVKLFDSIVSKSGSYQTYKVVKKTELSSFKDVLISNEENFNSTIKQLNSNIEAINKELDLIKSENDTLKEELENSKSLIDNISFFGIEISKNNYNIIVWSLVLVLVIIIGLILVKYRNTYIVNNEMKENLDNIYNEFETYKHISLEKQQKLGRELLDLKKQSIPNKTTKK